MDRLVLDRFARAAVMTALAALLIRSGRAEEPTNAAFGNGPLTLTAAKQTALSDNPGIAAASERIAAAGAVVRQAQAAYLPTLSAEVAFQHIADQPASSGMGDLEPQQLYTAAASVSWLAFDGFSRYFNLIAARHGRAVAEAAFDDSRRLLLQAVAVAYHNSLLARENIRIARQDAAFNRDLSEEARKRAAAGVAARGDVLNFEIRVARAESNLTEAEHTYAVSRTVLAELMGIPEAAMPEEVALAELAADAPLDGMPDVAAEVAYALERRPDYRQLAAAASQIEASVRALRGQYLPRVYVQGAYGESRLDNPRFNDSEDASSFAGAVLEWDLFTGGARRARIAEARASLREVRRQRDRLRLAIASEIRRELSAADTARRQVELQRRILEMTREVRALVRSAYLARSEKLTRVNEAQTDVVRAAGQHALARIRYWNALQAVAAASGRILEEQ